MAETPLARRLKARIAADGPLPLDVFWQAAMTDPEGGYYTTGKPIGAGGDFTTAPEISQIFGELIGLWLAEAWIRAGRPAPVRADRTWPRPRAVDGGCAPRRPRRAGFPGSG